MSSLDSYAHPDAGLPWYRFFWPWFIVALLGASVTAGISTVVIAYRHGDSLVRDQYYKHGKAINRVIGAERNARALGVAAGLEVDGQGGVVIVRLDEGRARRPERLALELRHATLADRDQRLVLEATGDGRYRAALTGALGGRYHLSLTPETETDAEWRLNRTTFLPPNEAVEFGDRR